MNAKEWRLKLGPGDVNAMLKYFNKMAADNHDLFHIYRLDDNGYLKDRMWFGLMLGRGPLMRNLMIWCASMQRI